MLRELLEPSLGDGDALTFWLVVADLETLAGGIMDYVSHVLLAQRTHYDEEELALGKLVESFSLVGRYLVSTGSFMASS